jgi:ABC-type branched-subunit amino acid transport system ATPase component/ABC-type branched-subunit amino acid transport system permease subunit
MSRYIAQPWLHGPAVAVVLLLVVLHLGASSYYGFLITVALLYLIGATGLNIPAGMLGQLSLAQGGFFAIGGYAAASLSVDHGWPIVFALLASMLLGFVLGSLLGFASGRIGAIGIGVTSLGFTVLVADLSVSLTSVTGGPAGRYGIVGKLLPWSKNDLNASQIFVLILIVTLLVYLGHWWFRASNPGRTCCATRDDEIGATALGISTMRIKIIAVGLGSGLGAVAGSLYGYAATVASPDAFGLSLSVLLLTMVILGGAGTTVGPAIGAAVLGTLPVLLAPYPKVSPYLYGGLLLVLLRFMPSGLIRHTGAPVLGKTYLKASKPSAEAAPPDRRASGDLEPRSGELLAVRSVSRDFGGLRAVSDVSLDLKAGEIVGLVGPNGSGKTTVINLISGYYPPTKGEIRLTNSRLPRHGHKVARCGVGRTFQTPKPFASLTIDEHLALAYKNRCGSDSITDRLVFPFLDSLGLLANRKREVRVLSHGQLRFLEIAVAVARLPQILLLDEPAAGLSPSEIEVLATLLRGLAADGIGILLVEHHLDMVTMMVDRIAVMNTGRLIWTGKPDEFANVPEVREVYLGSTGGAER